ncbi:MAG: sugar ABC transporter substrate-binding protein [Chloroflexi bacterium]|nr:sugar ABC transporter substrate-binding protein [Chloroflexota bacterium]
MKTMPSSGTSRVTGLFRGPGLSRRRFVVGALGAASVALLSACAAPAPTPTPLPLAKPTPLPAPTVAAPTPAAKPPAKASEVELVWSSWATDTYGMDRVKEQADLFGKERPEIKINIRNIASSGYREQILTQLAGGVGPDVFRLGPNDLFPFSDQGQLKELEPYFKADKSSWFWGDDLKPGIVDQMRLRGKLFALPMGGVAYCIYVNTTLFEKEGLPLPPKGYGDESWTFDRMTELARKLTKRRPDGGPEQLGIESSNRHEMKAIVDNANNGRSWISDDLSTFQGAEPGAVAGLQWAADLIHVHRVSPSAAEAQGGAFGFREGRLGIFWHGVSEASYLVTDIGTRFGWDIVPYPRWGKNPLSLWMEFSGWVMNAKGKRLDEAWTFLHFINGPTGQIPDVERGWALPIFKSLDSRYYTRIGQQKKNFIPALEGHLHANRVWLWKNPKWSESWRNHVKPAIDEVMAGKARANEAMAKIKPDVDKLLKEGAAQLQ